MSEIMPHDLRARVIRLAASLPPGHERTALLDLVAGRKPVVHLSPDWADLKQYHGPVDDVVLWLVEQSLIAQGYRVKREASGYEDGNNPPDNLSWDDQFDWDGAIDESNQVVDAYQRNVKNLKGWEPELQRTWCAAAFNARAPGQALRARPSAWHAKQWGSLKLYERGLLIKAELATWEGDPTDEAVVKGAWFRS